MSEPTGKIYTLRTFADLLQLDADQLIRFAAELPHIVLSSKFTNSLIGDLVIQEESPAITLAEIPWCDDGILSFSPVINGEQPFTLEVAHKDSAPPDEP